MAENIGQKMDTNGDECDHVLSFFGIFSDYPNFGRVVERGVAAM